MQKKTQSKFQLKKLIWQLWLFNIEKKKIFSEEILGVSLYV